jgi:protein TonB
MWRGSIFGIVAVTSVAALAEPSPPKAVLSSGLWITEADYPADALRGQIGGVVGYRLEVSSRGRATNCIVTRTSGNRPLDNATCALLISRSRFTPAKDDRGSAVAGQYDSQMTWVMPAF